MAMIPSAHCILRSAWRINPRINTISENPLSFSIFEIESELMKQCSREALIDLLMVALYLDKRISLVEDEAMNGALESLGWESSRSRAEHLFKAVTVAREVDGDAIAIDRFLDEKAAIIIENDDEAESLTWLSRVLDSEGLSFSDQQFLNHLESRFFPST